MSMNAVITQNMVALCVYRVRVDNVLNQTQPEAAHTLVATESIHQKRDD